MACDTAPLKTVSGKEKIMLFFVYIFKVNL